MRGSILAFMVLALSAVADTAGAQDFLRPEEAFRVEVESATAEMVSLRWTVAPGYYLYGERISVTSVAAGPVALIEQEVFGNPEVIEAMAGVQRLRPDLTDYDAQDRAILEHLQVAGPPTLLFFGADGEERRDQRIVGEVGPEAFLDNLQRAFGGE